MGIGCKPTHLACTTLRSMLRACFRIVGGRRVRARGLLEMAKITKRCRPGPLTGRFLNHALSQIMRVAPFPILAALLLGCATTSDPVDRLVTKLSSSHWLWLNGEFPSLGLPA